MITLKLITTNSSGGSVSITDISNSVLEDIVVEETVGDELQIKSGDLTIVTKDGSLPWSFSAWANWIGVYINDILFNVYSYPAPGGEEEYDEKTGEFKYRLQPLQKIFYSQARDAIIQYTSDTTDWNYAAQNGAVTIAEIKVINGAGAPLSILNRYGFSLGDMLDGLPGTYSYDGVDKGYQINSVNHDIPNGNDSDVPILYRGLSKDISDTMQNAINWNFYEDGSDEFHVNWMDIFKLVIFGWNAFLKIEPVITGGALKIDISFIPRINITASSAITDLVWIERKWTKDKYAIDGVHLSGKNFEYIQGDINGLNVFEYDVDISDPEKEIASYDKELYWSAGDYDSGDSDYNILVNGPYFATGLVEAYYTGLLGTGTGTGYTGKFLAYYNDGTEKIVRILDQIEISAYVNIQPNTLRIDRAGIAEFEGIEI